jgi:hypothetical protein
VLPRQSTSEKLTIAASYISMPKNSSSAVVH